jgi:hypothetical protein
MEQCACPDNIGFSLQLIKNRLGREDICGKEKRVQGVFIFEEIVSTIKKLRLDIGTNKILGGDAVSNLESSALFCDEEHFGSYKLSNFLSHTTSHIHEPLSFLEAVHNFGISWRL